MSLSSDSEWAAALAEVDSSARQPGLWARCFAQADGDENRAKAAYIAERVTAMGTLPLTAVNAPEPTPDGVCPSCGRACWLNALSCPQCAAVFGKEAAWQPRARQLGEVVVPDKQVAMARAAPTPPQAATKKGSNWIAWVIGVPVGLFLLLLVVGASMSPEKAAQYDKAARINAACDRMMSDSALGDERRMTRAICDQMKNNR